MDLFLWIYGKGIENSDSRPLLDCPRNVRRSTTVTHHSPIVLNRLPNSRYNQMLLRKVLFYIWKSMKKNYDSREEDVLIGISKIDERLEVKRKRVFFKKQKSH